ncbi:hypothetical protein BJ508DRAFT_411400 [Ascobolus immersus RN42]|uniref:Uncharacterized protein n=1 Tax=Ascobolus immersus RN42 TaxID=1160509 RepID=A0A3N4IKM7_ASCIM|nr:hypothetical protein BJ508DRAFT_411400 [Ascobolus immersus RN42]
MHHVGGEHGDGTAEYRYVSALFSFPVLSPCLCLKFQMFLFLVIGYNAVPGLNEFNTTYRDLACL